MTILALLLVLVIGWPAFLVWDANSTIGRTDALSGAAPTEGETWLLAGSDSRADGAVADDTEGQRADSIILVNVAPNGQASMISIPRDTFVEIPDQGGDKINASFALGGPQLLVRTVEGLTGLTVDHYAEIGMGGVGSIVDAVGGVELCYDRDVEDAYSELSWKAGCHLSDGRTALAFARMRYADPLGDIGRAERQRQVVSKTVAKATSPALVVNPLTALSLERAGAKALTIDRDGSVVDVAKLAFAFKKAQADRLSGAPPIASLDEQTNVGSAVVLVDDTAPDFFAKVREGSLTPEDFVQTF
ncbi:LCP family protein [Schaalia sp. 19OD2882]|uniref:LCP family protein n=1 Tax=Schaalia sp. 19OD2882 TaxID=2794089 RepID=UPI003466A31C